MNRTELKTYIIKTYSAVPDHPWAKYPNYEVFRHRANKKWFALVMDIPKARLGLQSDEMTEIANLKCGPVLTGSLQSEPGIFPAYHMNKTNWITVSLDGTVPDNKLKTLLDISFSLTGPKTKKKTAASGR